MKKFKFRLERILQYRQMIKDEKMRELLLRNNKLHEDKEKLKELETAALLNQLEENVLLTASEIHLTANYAARVKGEIFVQKDTLRESEEAVIAATVEYVEAAKDSKSLHTLKERNKERYHEHISKEEEKFLDELSVQKGNTIKKGE